MAAVRDLVTGKQLLTVLLKLFNFCVKVKMNRQQLIKPRMNAISIMLGALNLVSACIILTPPPPPPHTSFSISPLPSSLPQCMNAISIMLGALKLVSACLILIPPPPPCGRSNFPFPSSDVFCVNINMSITLILTLNSILTFTFNLASYA